MSNAIAVGNSKTTIFLAKDKEKKHHQDVNSQSSF